MVNSRQSGAGWSIDAFNDRALEALKKAPDALDQQLRNAVRDITQQIAVNIIRGMADFSPAGTPATGPVQRRSGDLARTVQGRMTGRTIKDIVGLITAGSRAVPYAETQEFGRTISAKPGKRLRVPLPEILTPRGLVKGNFEIVNTGRGWQTTGGKPTFIAGNAIMVDGPGGPTPIWALVQKVKIPARLGMGKAIDDYADEGISRLGEAFDKALEPGP